MTTITVTLRAQDGAILGTAEIDDMGPYPRLLQGDDGVMYLHDAIRGYVAAIPVAVIVRRVTPCRECGLTGTHKLGCSCRESP